MSAQIIAFPIKRALPPLVNDAAVWAHVQQPMEATVQRRKLDNCVGLLAEDQRASCCPAKLREARDAAPWAQIRLLPNIRDRVVPLRTVAAEWRYFTRLAERLAAPAHSRPAFITREEANALGARAVSPRTAARYAKDIAAALAVIDAKGGIRLVLDAERALAILGEDEPRDRIAPPARERLRRESCAPTNDPKGAA